MIYEYGEALQQGRFYEYLIDVLNACCDDWQNFIYNKIIDFQEEDLKTTKQKRAIKKAFMYLVNGGANQLLHEMIEHPSYSSLAQLILVFNKEVIPYCSIDLRGLKQYAPYKNLCMTLQRIESKGMQLAYVSAPIMWGFLVHDAIVCREVDKEVVMTAMKGTVPFLGFVEANIIS